MSIIAWDCDDCLILPPEATGLDRDTPNYELIALYRWFQKEGNRMIIWSGGGKDYAQMWGEKLGLKADEYRTKEKDMTVDICFDDCIVELAKVNIRVSRWNNRVQRTIPADRFNK